MKQPIFIKMLISFPLIFHNKKPRPLVLRERGDFYGAYYTATPDFHSVNRLTITASICFFE